MRTGWGRRAVVLATATLLVAGCSSGYDDDGTAETGGGLTTLDQGAAPTTADDGGGTGSPTTVGRPPTGSSGGTVPGGGTNRGPSPTTNAEDPIVQASRSAPGGFARMVLRPQPATKLALDVLAEPGAEPRTAAIIRVQRMLGEVTGKPVSVSGPAKIEGDKTSWTAADLRELADRSARTTQGGSQASLRMLFVHGTYQGDGSVLGVAIRGDVLAIFSDSIDRTASPVVREELIEEAVVMHEVGHLLGLVGLVIRPERQDPDHKGHSRNQESVMYWAVESNLIGQILGGDPPRDFDADDLADLAAMRGGA